ncbi:unnamed protein product [Lactuca virosa]|uniref:Uncharacterized protein n=1 Tax=Lactuca virosa TaxID=75947 RepID=A0AAU9LIK8_9ASTR|nr:unnamed protein product [Lactuca virosa]
MSGWMKKERKWLILMMPTMMVKQMRQGIQMIMATLIFFKNDNEPDYELSDNVGEGEHVTDVMGENEDNEKGHNKTTCPQVERPPKFNDRKTQCVRQTQESVNMERGGEDVAMGDVGGEDVAMGDAGGQDDRVHEQEVHFGKVEQPRKRKKSERILKLKLGKKLKVKVAVHQSLWMWSSVGVVYGGWVIT